MRFVIFLTAVVLSPALTVADDSSDFADKLMAARHSLDDAPYRALLHSSMTECKNFMLNKKPGVPPSEYEYSITEISERTLSNNEASARIAGLGSLSYTIEPTHEILISWDGVNEFPEQHPCHSETLNMFSAELTRENGRWRIATLCIPAEKYDALQSRIARGRELKEEREASVNNTYTRLDLEQREVLNSKLHEHKVHAIDYYSEVLEIDLAMAKGLWNKMCSEYQKPR